VRVRERKVPPHRWGSSWEDFRLLLRADFLMIIAAMRMAVKRFSYDVCPWTSFLLTDALVSRGSVRIGCYFHGF
jgi:hypothetical protein